MSEITVYEGGGQVDGYRPQIMTPEAARALDEQVRQCTKAVLREGTDYGIIPGTNEKTLWRPGAQKLLQWFQLECICERTEVERDDEGRKHGITYRAEVGRGLKTATPVILATCEGTADYDESKFYQSAEQVKERLRALENKWASKDGRRPNPERWMNATEYRADWNALMKRAQKRAIVGAVNDATGAGGVFSDREEDDAPVPAEDDGPSWYEHMLEQALTFTTQEEGRTLYVAAAQAGRDGIATRRQVDHVQNRIRQRAERLKRATPVDVEDLAKKAAAAAEDPSPAQAATPSAAAPPPTPSAGAGEAPPGGGERTPALAATGQLRQLDDHRQRLEYGDTQENWDAWLTDLAGLAGLAAIASPGELTQGEARKVISRLKGLDDRKALRRLLDTGEVRDGE